MRDGHDGSCEGKREARRRAYKDIQFLRKLHEAIRNVPCRKYDVIADKAEEKLSPVVQTIDAALDESMACEEVTTENMAFNGYLCSEYYDCNKYNSRRGMGTLVHNSIVNRDFLKTDFMIGHSYTAPEVWATPDGYVQIFAYETEDGCRYLARSIFRNYDINVNPDRFYIADPCSGGTTPESFEWKDRFGNPHTLDEVVRLNIKKIHPSWKMVERACSEKDFVRIEPAGKFQYGFRSDGQFKLLYADEKEVIPQWIEGLSKPVDGKTIVKPEGRYNLLDLTTGYLSMSEWLPFMGDFKDGWALVKDDRGKYNFIGTSAPTDS